MNIMKLVKNLGQPGCAALYAVSAYFAAKKKPLPLILLFLCHLTEYFIIGKKTGKEKGENAFMSALKCLSFGFTWWLPLRKEK